MTRIISRSVGSPLRVMLALIPIALSVTGCGGGHDRLAARGIGRHACGQVRLDRAHGGPFGIVAAFSSVTDRPCVFEDRYTLSIRDAAGARAIVREAGFVGLYAGKTPAPIIWNWFNFCVPGRRFRVEPRVRDAVLSTTSINPQHCVPGARSFAGYPMRLDREPLKTGFTPWRLWHMQLSDFRRT